MQTISFPKLSSNHILHCRYRGGCHGSGDMNKDPLSCAIMFNGRITEKNLKYSPRFAGCSL